MKGRKEIEEMINNSEYKDVLTNHENILRSYVMEKSVLPKLRRGSKMQSANRSSVFRLDTVGALNNLLHQKTFLDEIKNRGKTTKKKNKVNNRLINSSNKKVTFGDNSTLDESSTRPFSVDRSKDYYNSLSRNPEGK